VVPLFPLPPAISLSQANILVISIEFTGFFKKSKHKMFFCSIPCWYSILNAANNPSETVQGRRPDVLSLANKVQLLVGAHLRHHEPDLLGPRFGQGNNAGEPAGLFVDKPAEGQGLVVGVRRAVGADPKKSLFKSFGGSFCWR
jgi:hypothetical protein